MAHPAYVQTSLDELDEPLRLTTFTVVDLETTGGSAAADAITEVGAVRVCGGEVRGEFQTLVDPGVPITPFVSVLTGITDAMVSGSPRIGSVLPAFLEFARGSVLVAHNAPFDVGFLRAACIDQGLAWPGFPVVDTALLARRVLTRDEVPNCKLGTLAAFFGAGTSPNHRALADARATVDVLHALIGRLGSLGVQSLPELRAFTAQVSPAQRRKRHLADGLPAAPGVYVFRDAQGTPLYVGTSRNLRSRVRQYFVASETRTRMGEMVGLAERVDPIVCAHPLEAQVRELRLIAAHKPRYNRRSKFPERSAWLKLTDEAFPRLSIVPTARGEAAAYLGPLRSQRQAEAVRDAIHDAVPLRQCTDRLSVRRVVRAACALAGIGRCSAPCEGKVPAADYAALADLVAAAWAGDVRPLIGPLERKLAELSAAQRYEQAAVVRDRIATVVRACARMQRLQALTGIDELVAARPADDKHARRDTGARPGHPGWDIVVVRRGRLAAAGVAPAGTAPWPVIEALLATADTVDPEHEALTEESECILRWLEEPGVRLVHATHPWAVPAHGAGGLVSWLAADSAQRAASPFADRRPLPMSARPARASA
ncbi:DEDD exonuclease domain-containing protein [Jatrophihabitans cynanchi]|uniref:DEDD exonuclease domain-containing protein n=1 Tax=Jatrophihabitans cynanchi TaxID=2944128 RepID=A0ABY7K0I8_9ACTN|nr:DEDD exonuclease domain-containing protein [Jatrophihabitans sp. SB3-54]WAX58023.1 DEDD exonuclease domain-containing protein [Jatrophihabitans sp. SB3-54]